MTYITGSTLLNAYLFGSRLYNVHKDGSDGQEASDYDFIGVAGGEYFYAYRMIDTIYVPSHLNKSIKISININMLHINYLKESLKDAFINSVMLCYIPKDYVWIETIKLIDQFQLHLPNLRQSVQMDSTHNFAKARRLWKLGDFYTSKKNIVHGLRYLHYALQLLGPDSKITDFTKGNEYWYEILDMEEPTQEEINTDKSRQLWNLIEKRFYPLYQSLTIEMKQICDKEVEKAQQWEKEWMIKNLSSSNKRTLSTGPAPVSILIDCIMEYGLNTISRNFGIVINRSERFSNLVCLSRTPQACLELELVRWCSGIVLDESNAYNVVCCPYPKIFSSTSDRNMLPKIDWKNQGQFCVTDLLDGKLACLYYYGGRWNVSSSETADGSNIVGWIDPTRLPNWQDYICEGLNFNPVHESKMLITLDPSKPNPTFEENFWEIFQNMGYKLEQLDNMDKYCFIFELQNIHIPQVVEHKSNTIILTGCRDMHNGGQEVDLRDVKKLVPWKINEIREFDKLDMPTLEAYVRAFSPIERAGVVLKDEKANRLAIRAPAYHSLERLHPLSDIHQVTKCLLDLVRCGCSEDWLKMEKYSYWKPKYSIIKSQYEAVCSRMQSTWNEVSKACQAEGRSKSAAMLQDHPAFSSELFLLIKNETFDMTVAEHLSQIPIKRLQALMRRVLDLINPELKSDSSIDNSPNDSTLNDTATSDI